MKKTDNTKENPKKDPNRGLVWLARIVFFSELLALGAANLYLGTLSILPLKYQLTLAAVSAGLCVLSFLLTSKGRGQKLRCTVSLVLSLTVVVLTLAGTLYINHIYRSYDSSNENAGRVTTVMAVYVRVDAGYADIGDLADGVFGLNQDSPERTEQLLRQIRELLGDGFQTQTFPLLTDQVQALKDGQVDAIVLNAALVDTITEDIDLNFASWAVSIPVSITLEHQVETTQAGDVTKDPFIVYISGIDNRYGTVDDTGRSDVNILAVINPTAKKILLVNTPRDYYLGLYGDSSMMDKLTHAGLYGVDCSMQTLSALYGLDINYYVRVNFDSVVNIVDALGGITVWSDYTFYGSNSRSGRGYQFYEGENELDGDAALAFARERYSFGDGDRQRGRNQQAVISALIDKATSPAILTNFNSVLNTVLENMRTNISTDDINALIKMELDDMAKWDVQSVSVDGTGNSLHTYSAGYAYVMEPDMSTVQAAVDAINAVREG